MLFLLLLNKTRFIKMVSTFQLLCINKLMRWRERQSILFGMQMIQCGVCCTAQPYTNILKSYQLNSLKMPSHKEAERFIKYLDRFWTMFCTHRIAHRHHKHTNTPTPVSMTMCHNVKCELWYTNAHTTIHVYKANKIWFSISIPEHIHLS